ncbi:phospholipid scramblase 1 [Bachmanniomyces sp. S44760]|nr:phospholipid scramblase 1 [Bachmanniomyces sp. S44760]
MVNKILFTYLVFDGLFLCTGGLLLATVLIFKIGMEATPSTANVATNLLLEMTPLTGVLVNAALIFATFLMSLPGIFLSTNRSILRYHSFFVLGSACLTLILGLEIWISTLKTRSMLEGMWARETPEMQSLLQQRFGCCGYLNSTAPSFATDSICPNSVIAAQKPGCVGSFSNFANSFLDLLFTAMFGLVALDVMLFLNAMVVLKDRAEKKRYQHIDEKTGFGRI